MTADSLGLRGTRVLVTGAAGFIGSRLVARLVAEGARVHAMDLRASDAPGIEAAHVADITDAEAVDAVVAAARPVHVFHLAGFKERSSTPEAFRLASAVNVRGTLNLLFAMVELDPGAASFVAMGTSEEYGQGPTPFRESQPEQPLSAYGVSKAEATQLCRAFQRSMGVPAVVLRPTIAYGPGQPPDLFLSALVASLARGERFPMTAGEQTRDFVYVDDIVDAQLLAATTPAAAGRVINIGSGEPVRLRDLAQTVARLMDAEGLLGLGEVPYRTGENMEYRSDVSLAREILGWEPSVSLEEGLRRTIEAAGSAR